MAVFLKKFLFIKYAVLLKGFELAIAPEGIGNNRAAVVISMGRRGKKGQNGK